MHARSVMVDTSEPPPASAERSIRVFVSSTFRDMGGEREELIKRIFPQLRKLCESRGVAWGEVDLRWGVSDEQKAEGRVLPICLAEIRRCRPYFIGLLGERYGWIQDALPAQILAQEPWLAAYADRSVTELEILCGVLEDPEMAEHAYFYLRDPGFLAGIAPDQRSFFQETSAASTRKLAEIKDRIRRSAFPVRENYRDPRELGQLILDDFTRLIDRLFPEDTVSDPHDREAAIHDTYAVIRSRIFIGRRDALAQLDAHIGGDGPPLVVLGESGLGKSALLAHWVRGLRGTQPDTFVFAHFTGASADSTDWAALARRLISELKRRFGLGLTAPSEPAALRSALEEALRITGSTHRLVIVLDGLDQLDDHDQAPDLAWLPLDLPPRIRLIVSTLPGRALDEIERRGWPTLQLASLGPHERRQLIVDYLAQYTKTLSRAQVEEIAAAPSVGNPLFLTALLEELRIWGEHETLENRIRDYLASTSVDDLFQKILSRYEVDYERDRPGLVGESLSLIWAARRGLAEVELLDLLGDGEPAPHASWSPLFLAAERSLVSYSAGLLGFFHDYFRRAVRNRYLPSPEAQARAHLRLADYFAPRTPNQRRIDELPWQLAKAQAWRRLSAVLADLPFVYSAWGQMGYEMRGYWRQVEEHIPGEVLRAYRPVVANPDDHLDDLSLVAMILMWLDYPEESLRVQAGLIGLIDRATVENPETIGWPGSREGFTALISDAAFNYMNMGDLEKALEWSRVASSLARADPAGSDGAPIALEATILFEQGHKPEASALFDEAVGLARARGSQAALAQIVCNQALLVLHSDPARALSLLGEQERFLRQTGDLHSLTSCLGNQGIALKNLGRLDEAVKKLTEQERICRDIGDSRGLRLALLHLGADALQRSGDLETALTRFQEAETIARRLGDTKGAAEFLMFQASTKQAGNRLIEAIQLLKKAEALFAEAGETEATILVKFQQASLYVAHLRMPSAGLPGMREARQLAEQSGLTALAAQIDSAISELSAKRA